MLGSVSPYALLSASKPKQMPSIASAYDLFSTAQNLTGALPSTQPLPEKHSDSHSCPAIQTGFLPSQRKTRYIADIHTRHTFAAKHTSMNTASLP